MNSQLFVFPTRYKNEAFPLSVIEAFSYGVPVITTNEGSLPLMVTRESGIVVNSVINLNSALNKAFSLLINKETALYCRKHYLDNYTMDVFENNLLQIFSN